MPCNQSREDVLSSLHVLKVVSWRSRLPVPFNTCLSPYLIASPEFAFVPSLGPPVSLYQTFVKSRTLKLQDWPSRLMSEADWFTTSKSLEILLLQPLNLSLLRKALEIVQTTLCVKTYQPLAIAQQSILTSLAGLKEPIRIWHTKSNYGWLDVCSCYHDLSKIYLPLPTEASFKFLMGFNLSELIIEWTYL